MPDAANALSGLQTTYSRRPDKHSASGSYTSPCRMRLTPYPAYKLHAAVGLISTAHQAVPRTVPDAANALSGLQTTCSRRPDKCSAIRQFRAPCLYAANALSGLQTTYSRRPDKLREHRHLANQAISSAVLPLGAGYALSNCFNSSTESVISSTAAFCSTCATLAAFGMAITPD